MKRAYPFKQVTESVHKPCLHQIRLSSTPLPPLITTPAFRDLDISSAFIK